MRPKVFQSVSVRIRPGRTVVNARDIDVPAAALGVLGEEVELHTDLRDLDRIRHDREAGIGEHPLGDIGGLLALAGGASLEELEAVVIVVGGLEELLLAEDLDRTEPGSLALGVEPSLRNLAVLRIEIETESAPTGALRCDECRSRPEERVEDDVAFVGVEIDQPPWQLHGEWCRMLGAEPIRD